METKPKDTVMNPEKLYLLVKGKPANEEGRIIAEHQAEITWDIAFKAGKQEGRREEQERIIRILETGTGKSINHILKEISKPSSRNRG